MELTPAQEELLQTVASCRRIECSDNSEFSLDLIAIHTFLGDLHDRLAPEHMRLFNSDASTLNSNELTMYIVLMAHQVTILQRRAYGIE